MPAIAEKPRSVFRVNKGGQWCFVASPFWETLSDGDRGGGKTTGLLQTYLKHVGKGFDEDWRGVLFRLTYKQLKDVIDISKVFIRRSFPGAKFNKSDHEWTFETGEVLMFRYLETLSDYDNYHGHSYPWLGFEELTNWPTPEPYEAMLSCSRRRSARTDVPRMVRSTTNSWGVGHQWVKQRFIIGKLPYKPYGAPGRERIRIPTYWRENEQYVASDPDYHVRLAETITNEAQRKAWLENSWDIVAGGRFSDVWQESRHFIEPFNIPSNWRVDRSFDWGSSSPFATLWYAESNGESLVDGRSWPKGTLFVINEDYGCAGDMNDVNWKPNVGLGLDTIQIAKRVKAHEEDMLKWGLIVRKPQPGPADDPMFDVSRGTSMAKQMAGERVLWTRPSKGKGSRVTSADMLAQRLSASLKHPMEEPGIFIFNTCHHLRRTLPILPRDPKNPDDVQSDSEDHLYDALRLRLLFGIHGPVKRGVKL